MLEELRTETYVLGGMRQGVRQLRDENRRLYEMLKTEKQRIDRASEELAADDTEYMAAQEPKPVPVAATK